MNSLLQVALVVGACWTGAFQAPAPSEQDKRAKIEIFRAETKPAAGLTETTEPGSNKKLYLPKTADLTGADIAQVKSGKDSSGNPVIEITFTKAGAAKMTALSKDHVQKPMAIVIGGKVISAPTIRDPITSDQAVIQGPSAAEVEKLVKEING